MVHRTGWGLDRVGVGSAHGGAETNHVRTHRQRVLDFSDRALTGNARKGGAKRSRGREPQ